MSTISFRHIEPFPVSPFPQSVPASPRPAAAGEAATLPAFTPRRAR